jgi:hypothetical protein
MVETLEELEREAARIKDDLRRVKALIRQAKAALQPPAESEHNQIMTKAQKRERGYDVALAKAIKSRQPIRIAIAKSKWRTLRRYAKERLGGISESTLSKYLSSKEKNVPPAEIADRVKEDLREGDGSWPRPPRR